MVDVSFPSEDTIQVTYPNADPILLDKSDLAGAVTGCTTAALCFASPRLVTPGTKKTVSSIVFSKASDEAFDMLASGLSRIGSVDARHAPVMMTACERTSVQVLPGNNIVVWTTRGCTLCPAEHVVLQRTKGGMSTYDVHILHRDCGTVTTVDMLPHSTMGHWETAMGESHVFDAGPDPITTHLVRGLYDADENVWDVAGAFACTSSEEDDELSSEYASGDDDVMADSSDEQSDEASTSEEDSVSEEDSESEEEDSESEEDDSEDDSC